MDTKTNIFLTVFTIAILGVTLFFAIRKRTRLNKAGEPVYGRGDRGENVRKIQEWINNQNITEPLEIDGIFGEKTEKAVFALTGKKQIALSDLK